MSKSKPRVIYLPALLAEIAGVPRSEARRAIAEGKVTISGTRPWTYQDLPLSELGEFDYIEHPFGQQVFERFPLRQPSRASVILSRHAPPSP